MILGPRFESLSGTEGWKSGAVFGFVSMSLLTPISDSKSGRLGLLKQGFVTKVLHKQLFHGIWICFYSMVDFKGLDGGLENNFGDSWCLADRLKIA